MPEPKPTPSPSSAALDRMAALLALGALIFGAYALYTKLPREKIGATLTRALGEPTVTAVDLQTRHVEFVADFYGHRYKGNTENLIDAHVLFYGAWEKSILYFMRDCAKATGKDGAFVDVGANSGLHSLYMSSLVKQVHAVEPYPPALERIHDVVNRNNLTNVAIHPIGLGAEQSTMPFYEPVDSNIGTGSFLDGTYTLNHQEGLQLEIVRADDYFEANGIDSIDMMKIDIEGFEKFAMAGMQEQLRKHRPIVIMELSVNPGRDELFGSMDELVAAFPENYKLFGLPFTSFLSGSYELEPLTVDFSFRFQYDVIAVPAELADRIPMEATYTE